MEDRQKSLIVEIVRNYIKQAEPIGSKFLSGLFGLSSATIRNDMAELEAQGFLTQPHTSAGRVPTILAYQFFIRNLDHSKKLSTTEQETINGVLSGSRVDSEQKAKLLAKSLAQLAGDAALIGFAPHDVYYTGLSNLFAQPEFVELNMVRYMSQVIDHMDEAMNSLYAQAGDEVKIVLGDDNPFGRDCAVVFSNCRLNNSGIVFGLLGPLRMDYEANISRLNYVRQNIS